MNCEGLREERERESQPTLPADPTGEVKVNERSKLNEGR